MPIQAKVHARHIHIRSPKLLVEEFEEAVRQNYTDLPSPPQMSKVIRGLMFGYVTERLTEDPLELDAEMYRQEKEFFYSENPIRKTRKKK